MWHKAGFHKIELYYADKNTIYIAKNEFTKDFTKEDLNKLVQENNLPSSSYKLVDKTKIAKTNMEEIYYVRYHSTKEQDEYWNKLQKILIKDKPNFKIKRKYWL